MEFMVQLEGLFSRLEQSGHIVLSPKFLQRSWKNTQID
jgi:hypothetical protein